MRRVTLTQELSGTLTQIGPGLLDASLTACDGGSAILVSQLSFAVADRFSETGTLELGDGDALCFRTLFDGHLSAAADPTLRVGTAMREISSGTGALKGATGRIASIFVVNREGQVRDRELALVFLQEKQ
jgi:hypothetical protein